MDKRRSYVTPSLVTVNAVALLFAITAVIGWLIGNTPMKVGLFGGQPIKMNAAICMALLAFAAPAGYHVFSRRLTRAAAVSFAAAAGLIGLLTLVEYSMNAPFGLDEAIIRDFPLTGNALTPGRMALSTAIAITGLSVGIILNFLRRQAVIAQTIGIVTGLIGYFSLMTYVFNATLLRDVYSVTRMAVAAAVCGLSLSLLVIFSQRDKAFAGAILSGASGGQMARRLLPICLFAPLVMGGIAITLMNKGIIDPKMAMSTMAVATMVIILPIVIGLSWLMNRLSSGLTKETQEQANLAKELKILIGGLPVGVLVVDGRTLEPKNMNARAEAILGKPVAGSSPGVFSNLRRLLDQQGRDLPLELLPQLVALREGREAVEEVIGERPDGSKIIMKIHAVPVMDEANRPTAAVVTIEDSANADESQRQRLEFVSLVSHQLKSPLTSVRWTLESLLGNDYGQLNPDQLTAARQALNSTERMAVIVRDILNTSRIESGHLDLKPHWATAAEFLDIAVADVRAVALAKHVTINYTNDALRRLFIDTVLMQQAITNLLSNAVKYSPDGSVVDLKAKEGSSTLNIEVTDHGIGIPIADQQRLFGKFFRADNARESTTEGTGLGLYVCKAIVEAFGGTIDFVSVPDRGTTFRITLPLSSTPGEASPIDLNEN